MSNGIPKRAIQWKINARAHVSMSVIFSGIASGLLVNRSTIVSRSRGGQTFLPEGHMGHPIGLQRAALKKIYLLDNKCKSNLLLHET